ncbi:MAG TPA: hypothetical protein VLK33_11115, partial [Terriglobales bacterium]|nr:hypothetical protein [Terriglobales bacterium]
MSAQCGQSSRSAPDRLLRGPFELLEQLPLARGLDGGAYIANYALCVYLVDDEIGVLDQAAVNLVRSHPYTSRRADTAPSFRQFRNEN